MRIKCMDNNNIEKVEESSVKFICNKSFEYQGIIKVKLEEEKILGRCFFIIVKFFFF